MVKAGSQKIRIPRIIAEHIYSNLKEYIIASLIFVVGIFLGVMFINKAGSTQKQEITTYIEKYISSAKEHGGISTKETLKSSIRSNIILAITLWFAGTTLIGIPIVFGIILFRGFCLGYTISACTFTMGVGKGLAFILISTLLQNILFIPATVALGVSGMRLYKSIMKDKRKENIKLEILRHTALSVVMLVAMIASAVVKIKVSGGLVEGMIKYF